jgi:hypothetical protein
MGREKWHGDDGWLENLERDNNDESGSASVYSQAGDKRSSAVVYTKYGVTEVGRISFERRE